MIATLLPADGPQTVLGHRDEQIRLTTLSWLVSLRSPHTRRAYRRALTIWVGYAGVHGIDPTDPSRPDLHMWVAGMSHADGLAADTVRQRVAAVSGWLNELALNNLRPDTDPFHRISKPKRLAPLLSHVTTEQVRALLDGARTLDSPAETAIALLATLALRATEAGTVGRGSVTASPWGACLTVTGKGGKRVPVPFGPLVAAAAARVGWPADGFVRSATVDQPGVMVRSWLAAAQACTVGIEVRVTPHMLRHWCVTTALAAGEPLHMVQGFARHSDPAMTQRYNSARESVEGSAHTSALLAGILAVEG